MDQRILDLIYSAVGKSELLDETAKLLASDYFFPVLIGLMLIIVWITGRGETRITNQLTFFSSLLAIGLSNGATEIMNIFYFRARPFVEQHVELLFYRPTDSSFPSNAAVIAIAFGTAIFFRNRIAGVVTIILASLWPIARIYVGVHYPSDFLGGALIGISAGVVAVAITHQLEVIPRTFVRLLRSVYLA